MGENINLELRKEVLEIALHIERSVNSLLISYLNIEQTNLKAIGNKNSSLSFKNKIDLLSDIEVFSKDEHLRFLILMEFRNQFMHNIDCNSFIKAVQLLGNDRANQLLKHNKLEHEADLEKVYMHCYQELNIACIDSVLVKYENKRLQIQQRRKTITDIAEYSSYIINKDNELFNNLMEKCMPTIGDAKEILALKMNLINEMASFTNAMTEAEEYHHLSNTIAEVLNEKNIKAFFK